MMSQQRAIVALSGGWSPNRKYNPPGPNIMDSLLLGQFKAPSHPANPYNQSNLTTPPVNRGPANNNPQAL
jgi:hypothetical protein